MSMMCTQGGQVRKRKWLGLRVAGCGVGGTSLTRWDWVCFYRTSCKLTYCAVQYSTVTSCCGRRRGCATTVTTMIGRTETSSSFRMPGRETGEVAVAVASGSVIWRRSRAHTQVLHGGQAGIAQHILTTRCVPAPLRRIRDSIT
jgi:hypothetical protein